MGTQARRTATADTTFATNLATLRRTRGLTVRALSQCMNATPTPLLPSAITKIERGTRAVTIGEAASLCDILAASLDDMARQPARITFSQDCAEATA